MKRVRGKCRKAKKAKPKAKRVAFKKPPFTG
jgi:hypothetical protein